MKKILVIDDEIEVGKAIKLALEPEGYEVFVCNDCRAAIPTAKEVHPDLIFTDLMMPFKNGYEILIDVRHDDELKDVPVILSSSVNPTGKQSHFKWDEFLKKPLDFDSLRRAIDRLIGRGIWKKPS